MAFVVKQCDKRALSIESRALVRSATWNIKIRGVIIFKLIVWLRNLLQSGNVCHMWDEIMGKRNSRKQKVNDTIARTEIANLLLENVGKAANAAQPIILSNTVVYTKMRLNQKRMKFYVVHREPQRTENTTWSTRLQTDPKVVAVQTIKIA